ncbi:adapter protein MecA 1/2 [Lentibacillus halodurans]|uniref:Adapter protein MecA n=1 Tax=Lentibacillus halodurans TaxID=237679 RepID=A0A1I0W1S3_9BACI|nr:adaptor protein MecA [Lentibacillus halodurans]SFA82561.1 adapter protein MecA 1/2 [Lentibacillus halodurans]
MEIERINENTVKFYITYVDMEDRGFQREEIWYNRERGEQLFWQMMEELNYKEDFNVDGPLWIQVQAMDKGLEIVVTKAQISKDGENIELPDEDGKTVDISVDDKIEDVLDDKFGKERVGNATGNDAGDGSLALIVRFNDFEDLIQLSHYFQGNDEELENTLYHYKDHYYLYIVFPQEDDDRQEDLLSQIFEFANDTDVTIHFLEEYGNQIFETNTFGQIRSHFPAIIRRSE